MTAAEVEVYHDVPRVIPVCEVIYVHKMTFKESLHIMSTDVFFRVLFPRWTTRFSKKLEQVYLAYDELDVRRLHHTSRSYLSIARTEIHVRDDREPTEGGEEGRAL